MLGRPLDLEERAGVVLHHSFAGARRVFVEVAVVRVVILGLVARRVTFVADVIPRVAVVSGVVYIGQTKTVGNACEVSERKSVKGV